MKIGAALVVAAGLLSIGGAAQADVLPCLPDGGLPPGEVLCSGPDAGGQSPAEPPPVPVMPLPTPSRAPTDNAHHYAACITSRQFHGAPDDIGRRALEARWGVHGWRASTPVGMLWIYPMCGRLDIGRLYGIEFKQGRLYATVVLLNA